MCADRPRLRSTSTDSSSGQSNASTNHRNRSWYGYCMLWYVMVYDIQCTVVGGRLSRTIVDSTGERRSRTSTPTPSPSPPPLGEPTGMIQLVVAVQELAVLASRSLPVKALQVEHAHHRFRRVLRADPMDDPLADGFLSKPWIGSQAGGAIMIG